jgi:hypothetical protein
LIDKNTTIHLVDKNHNYHRGPAGHILLFVIMSEKRKNSPKWGFLFGLRDGSQKP